MTTTEAGKAVKPLTAALELAREIVTLSDKPSRLTVDELNRFTVMRQHTPAIARALLTAAERIETLERNQIPPGMAAVCQLCGESATERCTGYDSELGHLACPLKSASLPTSGEEV